jgi:hypothetical protein
MGDEIKWRRALDIYRERASLLLSFVRVDAFEVREHDVAIEDMSVRGACVFDDGFRDSVLVVAADLVAAARAGLRVSHDGVVRP